MTENNWYTFKSAGEKIGKSHSYFYSHFKKNPQYFKEGTFKKEGRIWLISDEGINHVLKQIKKSGVRRKSNFLSGLQSKKDSFAFTLNLLF
ncbi:hypothetical protein MPC59_003036 [Listeria monocytogenes]|nr:hypothetical protein [Listeria monocytogenes]EIZ6653605.1 hypothetical protein [Listeria monocytogenes]HDT8000323.1 hypothetical protein [Enterococcus faecalis]HDT8188127.1 hypothetical protein [Enterococcus faecalis]